MKNAVVLNEVKLAFVRSAATLLLLFTDWWSEATGCFLLCFCEERSDSLSLSFGFVERSDRLLLWSEATVYYFFRIGGAKRPVVFCYAFVERSDPYIFSLGFVE